MGLIALMLVGAPMGAFAVASTQRHTQPPSTAALHHHYFEAGKHECEQTIKHIEAQAQGEPGQLLGFRVLARVAGVPKEFRHDVSVGCEAAPG